jgi:hypothetical protein
MRITTILLVISIAATVFPSCTAPNDPRSRAAGPTIERLIELRKSDVQVEGEGTVSRILADDRDGSRHQRFIVRLRGDQTVLIQHNIDLAPRIEGIEEGDLVSFFGEYVWNEHGGLVHWTHHDPARRHVDGWIKHKGRTYQ